MISYGNTLAHYLNKKTYDEFSDEIRTENSKIISYGFSFYAAYIDFYQCYHLLAPNLAIFKNIVNNKYENNYNGKFLNIKFLNAVQISLIYKIVELIKLGEDSSKQFEAAKAKFTLEFNQRENELKELQKTNEQLQKEIESEKLKIDSLENTDLALLTKKIQSFNDLFVKTIKSKSPEENKEFFNLLNDFVKAKENLSKLSQSQIDKLNKKEPETKTPELREITQWTEPEAEFTLPQLISDWNSLKNSLQTKQPSLLAPKLTALFKKFEEFSKDKKEVIDIVIDDKSVLSTREDQYTLVKKVANNNNEPVVKG